MITFIFVVFLIFIPMYIFILFRRAFRIFRFVPYLVREIIVPHLYEVGQTKEKEGESKINLSPEKIKIIENSVLTSSLEVNPKRFRKKTKRKLSITFTIIGLVILALVAYQLFWFVYDYIVLTFF